MPLTTRARPPTISRPRATISWLSETIAAIRKAQPLRMASGSQKFSDSACGAEPGQMARAIVATPASTANARPKLCVEKRICRRDLHDTPMHLACRLLQRRQPDIAVAHGMAMLLEHNRPRGGCLGAATCCGPCQLHFGVHGDTVPHDADPRAFGLGVVRPAGGPERDVVRLPGARRSGGVFGGVLEAIDGAGVVLIGQGPAEGIEDL